MTGLARADNDDAASAAEQVATGIDKAAVGAVAEGFQRDRLRTDDGSTEALDFLSLRWSERDTACGGGRCRVDLRVADGVEHVDVFGEPQWVASKADTRILATSRRFGLRQCYIGSWCLRLAWITVWHFSG